MEPMNVRTLSRGEIGIISEITAPFLAAKRLADMGFVRGTRLEMIRPGSPCIVRLGGSCFVGLGRSYQIGIQLLRETVAG